MRGAAKVLRYTAFTLMAVFGVFGTLFVAGYAFEDPGGWIAAAMTAAWVLPMVGLSVLALRRPAASGRVLVWVTGAVALFTVADSTFGIIPRDDWGPVAAIVVFALGVALAFLGLHRPGLAGLLMAALAIAQVAATVVGIWARGGGEGPGAGALLGTSSGVVVVPLLAVGVLFLLADLAAGAAEDDHLAPPPAHHAA